jgi:TldD protein
VRTVAQRVLGRVPSSADYADVRVIFRRHEGIHVENQTVDQVLDEESEGIGLRVLVQGQWGFAASPHMGSMEMDDLVHRAMTQALCAVGRSATAPRPRRWC